MKRASLTARVTGFFVEPTSDTVVPSLVASSTAATCPGNAATGAATITSSAPETAAPRDSAASTRFALDRNGQCGRIEVPAAHVPHSRRARREPHRGTDEPGADNRKSLDPSQPWNSGYFCPSNAHLQRHPAQRRRPHRQLQRWLPPIRPDTGARRRLLLHRRPPRDHDRRTIRPSCATARSTSPRCSSPRASTRSARRSSSRATSPPTPRRPGCFRR